MALNDFFRINLPYGLVKNGNDEWTVFNREYKPLGWKTREHIDYQEFPIRVKYKRVSQSLLLDLAQKKEENEKGQITKIWLYNDKTNPMNSNKNWDEYFRKIKKLSKLEVNIK